MSRKHTTNQAVVEDDLSDVDNEEEYEEDYDGSPQEIIMIAQMMPEIDHNMDHDRIEKDIQDFQTYSDVSDWRGIVKYFDVLASVTSLVSTYDDWPMRFRIVDYLVSCFQSLPDDIQEFAQNYVLARKEDTQLPRSGELVKALPMFVVLVQRITIQIQLEVSKRQREAMAAVTGRKIKKAIVGELDVDSKHWIEVQRDRMIKCLCDILKLEVEVDGKKYKNCYEYVWKPDVVDPDFLKVIADAAFGVLDDPDCVRYTSQPWLQKVFNVVKILAVEHNKTDEMARRILEKTVSVEYLREPGCNTYPFIEPIVALGYNSNPRMSRDLRPLLERLTSLVCTISNLKLSSLKPLALLIQALGEHVPDILLLNLLQFCRLLDNDQMLIRSAALTALADVYRSDYLTEDICKKFDNRRNQRIFILRKMMVHFHDSNAQTRAKVINLFQKFMENGRHLPREFQCMGLISLIGRRLVDKSVMVRKAAVHFLTTFLTWNAFGHDFNRDVVTDKLRELIREMRDMKNPENSVVEQIDAVWKRDNAAMKQNLRNEVNRYVDGSVFGELVLEGIDNLVDYHETCLNRLLNQPAAVVTILMHIYAKKNQLPLLNSDQTRDEQFSEVYSYLLQKMEDEFRLNCVREHQLNDEALTLEVQRMDDYHDKRRQLQKAIELCKDKLVVEEELRQCVDHALRSVLMGELSEMKESIKFLAKCKQFNVRDAENAIRSMCSLVWRNSPEVRKELLDAAEEMFISQYTNVNEKETVREDSTVSNLMNAMKDISQDDSLSLEEVIYLLATKNMFTRNVVNKIWTIASDIMRENRVRIDALRILHAISRSQMGVSESRQRLRTLQKMLSLETSLAYEALRIISVLSTHKQSFSSPEDVMASSFRIANEDSLFKSVEQLFFTEMLRDSDDRNWFGVMRVSIDIFLNIARDGNELLPQIAAAFLYRARRAAEFFAYYKKEADRANGTRRILAGQRRDYWAKAWLRINERLVAFSGEVAIKMHAFGQLTLPRVHAKYESQMRYAHSNETKIEEEQPRVLNETENLNVKRRSLFEYTLEASQGESDNFMHGLTQTFNEKRLLRPQRLLGRLLPIVVYAMRARNAPERLRLSATMAFGKFMTLSKNQSEFAAPTFFSLMSKAPYSLNRSNLLAACSDFAFAQPNLFELYAPNLYKMARDSNPETRESAILVLSHLMSNDMIQIRGALSEPARCICDDVSAVETIACSFFTDLNRRGDALLNLLPEFIYRLACTGERIPFWQYDKIFKFLIGLIREKAKAVVDSMIERVCSKFAALQTSSTTHPDSPHYLAFALSRFTLSDTGFYKLKENIRHWSRFVNIEQVSKLISEMLLALRNTTKNEDVKREVQELLTRIETIKREGLTYDILTVPEPTPKVRGKSRKLPQSRPIKKRVRSPAPNSDSD